MSACSPLAVRIIALASFLVPSHRRARWRRQWEAEVEHRRRLGESHTRVAVFALGSFRHAAFARREEAAMRGLFTDLRHSARALVRQRGFTALTVVTFAIGVGSATAVFSLVEALLLRPLPLEHNDRLVRIYSSQPRRDVSRFSVSWPDYVDFTVRTDLFEASSFYTVQRQDVSGEGEPRRVRTASVHRDFFQTLGSPVRLGRTFQPSDHDPGQPLTAVLSESFWVGALAADSAMLGGTIRLDGVPHVVAGVVQDRHGWPAGTDVWVPLQWGSVVPDYVGRRSNHSWQVIARLQPGVDVEEASMQVRTMARTLYTRPGTDERDVGIEALVVPLHSSEGGDGAAALFATLGGGVFFVLVIACLNAGGLLAVRAWGRERELALRSALGAGRSRLALIVLGESALLALVGGAFGVGVGVLALKRAFAMAPPEITALGDPGLHPSVLGAGLTLSLFAALLAGVLPGIRASGTSVAQSLKKGGVSASPGRGARRMRQALVVVEVALSLTLLVGAGLTVRGFQRQIAIDPGFEADDVMAFTVRLPATRYDDDALVEAFFAQARERLEGHPVVQSATVTSRLPLGSGGLSLVRAFGFEGDPMPPEGVAYNAAWIEVDPAWFGTLGVSPRAGRGFSVEDRDETEPVAIVSESMARRMGAGDDVLGRRIRSVYDENVLRTVVGIVPDIQINGVARPDPFPAVYVPRSQSMRRSMGFLVRVAGDPGDAVSAIRGVMSEIDAEVALAELQSLRRAHAADLAGIRFLTTLFGSFGILALLLAVGGVYGLVAHSVSRRQREIGVRMAMGANPGAVRRSVLGESIATGAIGVAIGLAMAYGAGTVLSVGMSGVAALELSTFVGVAVVLVAAVLAATWIPAMRATKVDPVEALRIE